MLKRHKKHPEPAVEDGSNGFAKARSCSRRGAPPASKCYSVDDNFHTYANYRIDLHQTNRNFYTCGSRGKHKKDNRRGKLKSPEDRPPPRDDVLFKKFLKVLNPTNTSNSCANVAPTGSSRDWFALSANSMMEFAPKMLTRKLCGRKNNSGDNELYRSNSFKFEKFDRKDTDTLSTCRSTISRQISLCDDYSLPVDFVNKRPLSLDSGTLWSSPSHSSSQIDALNLYCSPKIPVQNPRLQNTETECNNFKLYASLTKAYSDPYTDSANSDIEEAAEPDVPHLTTIRDSFSRRPTIPSRHKFHPRNTNYTEVRKSPYYYGDLLKKKEEEQRLLKDGPSRRSNSAEGFESRKLPPQRIYNSLSLKDFKTRETVLDSSFDIQEEEEEDEDYTDDDDMATKQRQIYETAFDSKVYRRKVLDLDVDVVTNHVLERCSPQTPHNVCTPCAMQKAHEDRCKNRTPTTSDLAQNMKRLDLNDQSKVYTPSVSPAAKIKVPSMSETMDPALSPEGGSIENGDDARLRIREEISAHIDHLVRKRSRPRCCRGCGRSPADRPKSCHIVDPKIRPRRNGGKSSSTESMTTSSSGGSLESIRSSTSEGNRSTTSTDSHHSSSLSSHSSDSTGPPPAAPPTGRPFLNQKLHVLSPISDKSFQEFTDLGEPSNKSQSTPEASKCTSPMNESRPTVNDSRLAVNDSFKMKKKYPPTKALMNLNPPFKLTNELDAHHGSDSGISMESRDASKLNQLNELQDLPFDMPKLRRRRLQQMQSSTQDTSSSATSVDLKDLPFDMPKLRRKLKSETASSPEIGGNAACLESIDAEDTSGPNEADSGQTVLNLNFDQNKNRRSLNLNLSELNDTKSAADYIEVNIPLERQGWYHGAITRMEAENELRHKEEGSFLVRNSESSKNDFSLSLKSAKGFMHMKIQKCPENGKFVLGHFSSPFDTIPHMVRHFSNNRLPIRGAEHMCLLQPVVAQLL